MSNYDTIIKKYGLDLEYTYKEYVFITVVLSVITKHVLQSVFDLSLIHI